jgi:Trk K+ transport system NAD-binding subunit
VTFAGGDVEIVEMTLAEAADGLKVGKFEVAEELRVAAVRRGGRTLIPDDDFKLRGGDLVVAAARSGARARVHKYLAGPAPS